MKIGIDTTFYSDSPTGIGRYVYELCYHLNNYQDLELVLFLDKNSPLNNDPHFKDNQKILINLSKLDIRRLYKLGKLVDKANLDLFHCPAYNIPFVKNTKYIVSIHDLIHLKFKEEYGFLHRLYYENIVKKGCNKAEKIITVSESSKNDLLEWLNCSNNKIQVTYLAANQHFIPNLGMSDLFRKMEVDQNNFILYVGNNRPNKNLERLIIAYARISEEHENFPSLVLTCSANNKLTELCKNLFISDKVVFAGSIDEEELILLYSYAMFFIFPSYYEGFGLPLVEAMSSGCPITASDISSIPEVTGDAALYFNPYDIKDIKLALKEMYEDYSLRSLLAKRGLLRAKQFNWEKTAEKTYMIYKQCINND